jgi:hypothetical protein
MSTTTSPRGALAGRSGAQTAAAVELRCDFCGELVSRVRRVALDRGYERLRTPHQVRYACSACSERKERQRLGD